MTAAPEAAALLARLREALTLTTRFGQRQLGPSIWEPAVRSEGANELANTEVGAGGKAWSDRQPRTAYAAANLLMTAVLDNLASLERLLDDQMPAIGATVLARSAVEIGATAWWLMEPGIGVRKRVCRELVLSLTSARRAGQVATLFQAGPRQAQALAQEANVTRRIANLGLPAPTAGYSPQMGGEACMTATNLTAEMLRSTLASSTPAESIYRVSSAVTHGEIYGLMNFMQPETQPDGSAILRWGLPGDVLDSTIQLAIVAFREPYLRINKVMDWGKIEHQLWSTKLARIFTP